MKLRLTVVQIIGALILSVGALGGSMARPDDCFMPSPPHVVRQEASILLQYWLLEDRTQFHESTLPGSSSLMEFRERISQSMSVEPYALLKRQLSYVSGGDAENVRLVLNGAVPIRTMSCLESLLLATQAERSTSQGRSMYTNPTEFSSYILRRGDSLKIWYYTVDQPGIGGLASLHVPVMADIQQGWAVVSTIHNHNFFPLADGVMGGVVPSATDIQYFRNVRSSMGVTRAVIVNGFHSLDISATDFDRFAAP